MSPHDPDDLAAIAALRDDVARLLADAVTTRAESRAETKRVRDANDRTSRQLEGEHASEMSAMHEALDSLEARFDAVLAERTVIGQAQGVLMATLLCTVDGAFDLMRTQSQHENRKLDDIAAQIVARAMERSKPRPGVALSANPLP